MPVISVDCGVDATGVGVPTAFPHRTEKQECE
jgi:hypothetical protein